MQLIINNFGPIKTGEIDLSKKFYVFVGYNNSGKTYVSHLLWAIFNENNIKTFSKACQIEDSNHFELTQIMIDQILNQFAYFLTEKVIPHTFNVENDHLMLDKLSLKFKFKLEGLVNYNWKSTYLLRVSEQNSEFLTLSKNEGSLRVKVEKIRSKDINVSSTNLFDEKAPKSSIMVEFILALILNNTHKPIFLPSSRLVYPIFYEYFYRLEKEKKQEMSKRVLDLLEKKNKGEPFQLDSLSISSFKGFYTEPMDLLFDKVYRLNENATANTYYKNIIAALSKIIGGDIIMKKRLGIAPIEFYLSLSHKPDEDLEMYLSSSSVNQLSTLYLYFKYWAYEANNFLMIDEPEENLHPKHQMALLNVLLKFANENNNRVLMTTHSPLLADMINNYHYLAFLKSKRIPINPLIENYPELQLDINLTIEDIAIYFFEGDNIQTYKMGEYGVFFDDFHYELRKTQNISEILTDQIYHVINNGDS
jgi:AAA15 family ATPase/GTPase